MRLIREINEDRFEITSEYKGDLIYHIEILAVEGFKKMHKMYLKENSPQALLDKKRQLYHDRFMIEVDQENAAAEFCDTVLKTIILENIFEDLNASDLLDELQEKGNDVFRSLKSLQTTVT